VSFDVNGDVADSRPCSSCKEILDLNSGAPSGLYSIKTVRGKILEDVSIDYI